MPLSSSPGEARASRIVLITRGLDPADLQKSFEVFLFGNLAEAGKPSLGS
jgi:hypothetical protein